MYNPFNSPNIQQLIFEILSHFIYSSQTQISGKAIYGPAEYKFIDIPEFSQAVGIWFLEILIVNAGKWLQSERKIPLYIASILF